MGFDYVFPSSICAHIVSFLDNSSLDAQARFRLHTVQPPEHIRGFTRQMSTEVPWIPQHQTPLPMPAPPPNDMTTGRNIIPSQVRQSHTNATNDVPTMSANSPGNGGCSTIPTTLAPTNDSPPHETRQIASSSPAIQEEKLNIAEAEHYAIGERYLAEERAERQRLQAIGQDLMPVPDDGF